MNEHQIQVVYTASRNLYPYLPVAYMTVLAHHADAKIWLLIEDDKLPYRTPPNVEVVNVSRQTLFPPDGPNSRSEFTYLAMIRSAFPILFNGKFSDIGVRGLPRVDKIISLDCDTVVCDSLRPIWDVDLTDKWFAAVPQYFDISRPFGKTHPYRNAGVVVMNLEQMRKDHVAERSIDLLNRQQYVFIDEEVLNLVNMAEGDSKCVDLPSRYNEHLEVTLSLRPAIVHYAGEKMVWQKDMDDVYRGHYLKPWLQFAQEEACRNAGIKF